MPDYTFRCGSCQFEDDFTFSMDSRPRLLPCDECGGRMQQVIGAGVQIGPLTAEARTKQGRYEQDHAAYRRMRDHGLQPDHVQGSHRLEHTVEDQFDIQYKQRVGAPAAAVLNEPWKATKQRIREGMEAVQEAASA